MATPSRRPRGEVPRLPTHPIPWRIQGPLKSELTACGRPGYSNIIDRNGYYVAEMLAPDAAELIVKAVNAGPRRKGHWYVTEYESATCSECGWMEFMSWDSTSEAREKVKTVHEEYKFCPHCGAEMEGVNDG